MDGPPTAAPTGDAPPAGDGVPREGGERGGFRGRDGGRGGDRRGFGFGRGGRGGRGGGGSRFGDRKGGDNWKPLTKLGRLVKFGHIKFIEEIYTHSIPIKEAEITDKLLNHKKDRGDGTIAELCDEIMCILSVQKQTKAGQRTRFKAVVACGDKAGHCGIGIKVAKEVQIAIKGALLDGKMQMIPVRRGYWGSKLGNVHTIPVKVKGKCGSCCVRMIPAPRGTG